MAKPGGHTLHAAHRHYGWDNALTPVQRIGPSTTLRFECADAGDGHFGPASTAGDVLTLDPSRANPVTGPVFVDGAEPGDALKITIGDFEPSGIGWTANIPGFGLLADQFPDPALHLWRYDTGGKAPALFGPGGRVPVRPFAGTLGLAPAVPGPHSVIPPRRVGGNLDVRDLAAGSVLWLPVEVAGALFSVGDTHAAQGDGEVCGTAIESAMAVTLRFDLVKGAAPRFPRFEVPDTASSRPGEAGVRDVTTGIGPDLMAGARDAVAGMVDLIAAREGMAAVDAYMLCSVAGDLRISEIVDAPNWVMSFHMPRRVFD